ncbi:hypothetical protein [Streptococcus anginosus]|nr:hypothetical protein [Streptococcus anginosus]
MAKIDELTDFKQISEVDNILSSARKEDNKLREEQRRQQEQQRKQEQEAKKRARKEFWK